MKSFATGLIALACLSTIAFAEDGSFQLSLFPDIAIHDDTDNINGLAINVWGMNPQHALDLGIINGSYGQSGGLSLSFINYSENYTGVQWGLLNSATCDFTGWQAGWINYTADNFTGFQLAFLNYAGRLSGLQLGLVNMAAQADHGVQIGLLNLLPENREWFSSHPVDQIGPAMVIVNWRL